MFDLSTLKINTYLFGFADGEKIHLKSLTQKMYIEVSELQKEASKVANEDVEKQLDINNKMILMFLNNNVERKTYDMDIVKNIFDDLSTANMFIDDYMQFVQTGKDNPN